ncbi:hypothetical protein ACGFY9_14040 [Streptomyces sp. NPDC048504]|uniref:hypothetical protein n=1 Tax=Streptomyces sp. NPDC048504 TaxID=3365559 RepID=UPI00371F8F62
MISETEAKPHENTHASLTLVDGTQVNGYISGVGYSGLRVMVKGTETEWRFRAIAKIEAQR